MLYQGRIAKVRENMAAQGIDLLVLTHSTDLFYLTGLTGHMMERLACLLLTDREAHFVAPGFEMEKVRGESAQLLTCHGWTDGEDPFALAESLLEGGEKTAAMGATAPSWALVGMMERLPGYRWKNADALLLGMRVIKDEYERRMMTQVQEKACRGLARLMERGVGGMTERQAFRLLQELCAEEGVTCTGGIVASGPNSAFPHHSPTDRVIAKGDPVTIDFVGHEPGIGYQADTTRTFCVESIPQGFAQVYETVRRANQAAFEASQPGTPCQEVDKAARDVIAAAGYGEYFTHRVGHGLGLDVHEHPYMAMGNDAPIVPGNTFSDEPGIYIPGLYGVRIEDQIFVTPDGPVRMTPTDGILDHSLRVIG